MWFTAKFNSTLLIVKAKELQVSLVNEMQRLSDLNLVKSKSEISKLKMSSLFINSGSSINGKSVNRLKLL